MIERVISGAQTGADIAALRVAKHLGIETGGWIPKGYRTQDGPRPEYGRLYNLTEHCSPDYAPRTYLNVRDSDGTIRFAADFSSPGERCTRKAIIHYKRPHFDVDLVDLDPESMAKAVVWLKEHDILILNVAGNTQKTHAGAELKTTLYLNKLFQRIGFEDP